MNSEMISSSSFQLARRPIEVFQNDLQGVCGSFDLYAKTRDDVQGHLSVAKFGGLELARVGVDVDHVNRRAANIRRDPGNHFFLILQHQGLAQLIQGDVATWAKPGDMFVVDSTKESTFFYGGEASLQISLHLPRDEMFHRFGKRIYGGLSIDGSDPMAVAMKAVLAKLMTSTEVETHPHTVEAFYSVFGALITERALGNGGQVNPDRQLAHHAVRLMAEHYRDPALSTQHIADLAGVSLRRLQRAFQVIDETPHQRLRRFRVEAVHQALQAQSTSQAATTVTALALNAGFGDLSTFYRAYREHYGKTPGESQG